MTKAAHLVSWHSTEYMAAQSRIIGRGVQNSAKTVAGSIAIIVAFLYSSSFDKAINENTRNRGRKSSPIAKAQRREMAGDNITSLGGRLLDTDIHVDLAKTSRT